MGFLSDPLFWREWFTSSGFGGTTAVLAAAIAYAGVSASIRHQRRQMHRAEWWERAKWALDSMVSDDPDVRMAGARVADALATSEYADVHERSLLVAANHRGIEEVAVDEAHGPMRESGTQPARRRRRPW